MTRTILDIGQSVASLAGGAVPQALVGNNDRIATRILTSIRHTGAELSRVKSPEGGGWTMLELEASITTIPGRRDYPLPEGFTHVIGQTLWSDSDFRSARGSLTPQEWRLRRSNYYSGFTGLRQNFRVRRVGDRRVLSLDHIPGTEEVVVFEYVSNAWVVDGTTGLTRVDIGSDSDKTVFDPDVVELGALHKYQETIGSGAYGTTLDRYEIAREEAFSDDRQVEDIILGRLDSDDDRDYGLPLIGGLYQFVDS